MPFPRRLKVGLALGGGAARGLAHVGVVRALLREGIPIDVVTGTSMGAIVGGAFCATGNIAAVEAALRQVFASEQFRRTRLSFLKESRHHRGGLMYSISRLVRQGIVYGVSTMRPSFVSAEEFQGSVQAILPDVAIEDLKTTFGCVALDLENAEEVVFSRGSLRDAAAASSAIPGLFPARRMGKRLLVDGGWIDKVPVLPAYRLGADVAIGVDISADLEAAQDLGRGVDVMIRANAMKDIALTGFQRRFADVLLEPSVQRVHWADFDQADYCITAGDLAATAAAPAIRRLLLRERWRAWFRPPPGRRHAEYHLSRSDLRFVVE